MKKYFYFISLALFSLNAFAQRQHDVTYPVHASWLHNLSEQRAANDTLYPPFDWDCSISPSMTNAMGGGFVTGGNIFGDLAKAQFFNSFVQGEVHAVLVLGGGKFGSAASQYKARLYTGTQEEGPEIEFGASENVSALDFDVTDGSFTSFSFNPPVSISGGFFASVDVADGANWIGISHTPAGCGSYTAWEQWSSGTWFRMDDAASWNLDILLWILVEVDATNLSSHPMLIQRGTHKVFPNPARDETTLAFSLPQPSTMRLEVTDLTGKLILHQHMGFCAEGLHGHAISTQLLTAGIYLYRIIGDENTFQGKLIIAR